MFWEEYVVYARSVKWPKTVHNDKRIYLKFTAWMNQLGCKYLDQINEVQFEAYRIHLQQNRLQKSSINLEHRHLSSIDNKNHPIVLISRRGGRGKPIDQASLSFSIERQFS